MDFRFCPGCAVPLIRLPSGTDAGLLGCPHGHYIHYANPAVTAFAFIEDDGRYLALRRAHAPELGDWDLPGGFIEAGEYPDDAIRREILEETALTVSGLRVFGAWTGQYGEGGKWTVDIAYHCQREAGAVVISDEKSQAMWVTLEDFPAPAFNSERLALDVLRHS
ncbi:MAG: putative ADP-ribose pyrophosphatase [Solirubrobacterales bacterium]|nr:putative ADP-ribose pyrophosphatase [Solirubrobacterales bacterium]